MKKILLTGGTGFIGKNVLPMLKKSFEVIAPNRRELDLLSSVEVSKFLNRDSFDAVVHCANPNPVKNATDDSSDNMFENSLRLFMNLYTAHGLYGKLIYIGSGAEYDKTMDIVSVREEECFRSLPKDIYGLAKYIMNSIADKSENVYNLCVFGCYGPYDFHTKFITHCIDCCVREKPITIRQDCRFDYIHVYDLAEMMRWMITNDMRYHMYNASGGASHLLSELACKVRQQMKVNVPITILSGGLNKEYTANGERFVKESGISPTISIEEGIKIQIEWQVKGKLRV